MEDKTCQACKYFYLNYIKIAEDYFPLSDGHCLSPKLERHDCDAPACERFSPIEE